IPSFMARNSTAKKPRNATGKPRKKDVKRHARGKGPGARLVADTQAAHAKIPPWSAAEVEQAFRRFKTAAPEPKTELQHANPFTLLVAVVLSAQATDAGVNKATPALFALADTPEKMAAL